MNFYSMNICNFRTKYVIRHGSSTECQQRLLAAFRCFSCHFCACPTRLFEVDLYLVC